MQDFVKLKDALTVTNIRCVRASVLPTVELLLIKTKILKINSISNLLLQEVSIKL